MTPAVAMSALAGLVALVGGCGPDRSGSGGSLHFVDVSAESGLPLSGATSGAVLVDLDGDGARDLLLGRHCGAPRAFRNRGDCRFEPVPGWGPDLGDFDHHATVADDLDRDGVIDFYLVAGAHRGEGVGANAFLSGASRPLRDSAGAWGITDPFGRGRGAVGLDLGGDQVSDLCVLNFRTAPRCFALGPTPPATDRAHAHLGVQPADDAAVAGGAPRSRTEYVVSLLPADLDGDGRAELLALGGGLPLKLLRTTATGVEMDVAALPPAAYLPEARAAAWGDLDGDHRPDLFLVYGADDEPSHFQAPRRNRLLFWRGDRFEERTPTGLAAEGQGTACVAADLDGDGNLDLAVLRTRRDRHESRVLLYRNLGGDAVAFAAPLEYGPFAGIGDALLAGDVDDDGDIDLVVLDGAVDTGAADGGARLLRNTSRRHHCLTIRFDPGATAVSPYGASVEVVAGGRTQVRQFWPTQVGGSAYRGRMQVGVGEATIVESLRITWPDGRVLHLTDIAADRVIAAQ